MATTFATARRIDHGACGRYSWDCVEYPDGARRYRFFDVPEMAPILTLSLHAPEEAILIAAVLDTAFENGAESVRRDLRRRLNLEPEGATG